MIYTNETVRGHIKLSSLLLVSFVTSAPLASAETWDFRDQYLGVNIAHEEKMDNDSYEGTKIMLEGQYAIENVPEEISEKRKCCQMPSRPEHFYGLMDAHLRWGVEDTGLEYIRLGFTPWATLWEPDDDTSKKLRATRDQLELAAIRYIRDDPLEVDSYLELSALRAGRMGAYNWSQNSPFTITAGMQASTGWAWAKSDDPAYATVSNPFAGIYYDLAIEHNRWGRIYTSGRFVNGFSFSNPTRGHPTAREAKARFGFSSAFSNCLTLDIFIEKRSFYFDEGDLPALYTMSGTAGAELACHW